MKPKGAGHRKRYTTSSTTVHPYTVTYILSLHPTLHPIALTVPTDCFEIHGAPSSRGQHKYTNVPRNVPRQLNSHRERLQQLSATLDGVWWGHSCAFACPPTWGLSWRLFQSQNQPQPVRKCALSLGEEIFCTATLCHRLRVFKRERKK